MYFIFVAIGWNLDSASVYEGENIRVKFGLLPINNDEDKIMDKIIKCELFKLLPINIKISADYFFLSKPNFIKNILVMTLVDDISCIDKIFTIEMICVNENENVLNIENPKLRIVIKNLTPEIFCKNSYLSQKVIGLDENNRIVKKRICYNNFGKFGDQYNIFTDRIQSKKFIEICSNYIIYFANYYQILSFTLESSVFVKLDEHENICKVNIHSPDGLIEINNESININHNRRLFWDNIHNITNQERNSTKKFTLDVYGNALTLTLITDNRLEVIRIIKIEKKANYHFLNVLLEETSGNLKILDNNHNGLFQLISNQEYRFFDPIENEQDIVFININGKFIESRIINNLSYHEKCYLMNLNHFIELNRRLIYKSHS